MHFDVGKLNKRIGFYKYVEVLEDGFITLSKTKVRECWAKIRTSRSYETNVEEKLKGEFVYTILVRYFDDLTLDMLIMYKDKELKINQINNIDERNYAYEIVAIDKGAEPNINITKGGDINELF